MIEATGLGRTRRGKAILDSLSFQAQPGTVTALLGPAGSGKSTALRLMVELERGRGATLFDGRPYRRLRRPAREVGVMLTTEGWHPRHRAISHLRMVAAAAGLPTSAADEVMELVGLGAVRRHRPVDFSTGMNRRLALAGALIGDPMALLLDDPMEGLDLPGAGWLEEFLRAAARHGRTVIVAGRPSARMLAVADRVLALDQGQLIADVTTERFRAAVTPEVLVRSPEAGRLAGVLRLEGVRIIEETSGSLRLADTEPALIGGYAAREGIALHELTRYQGDPCLAHWPRMAPADGGAEHRAPVRAKAIAARRVFEPRPGQHADDQHLDDRQRDDQHRDDPLVAEPRPAFAELPLNDTQPLPEEALRAMRSGRLVMLAPSGAATDPEPVPSAGPAEGEGA